MMSTIASAATATPAMITLAGKMTAPTLQPEVSICCCEKFAGHSDGLLINNIAAIVSKTASSEPNNKVLACGFQFLNGRLNMIAVPRSY